MRAVTGFLALAVFAFTATVSLAQEPVYDVPEVHTPGPVSSIVAMTTYKGDWLALGRGGALFRSTDGISWNIQNIVYDDGNGLTQVDGNLTLTGIATNGDAIVVVGRGGFVLRSDDYENWEQITIEGAGTLNWVAGGAPRTLTDGYFVAVGDDRQAYWSNNYGATWTPYVVPDSMSETADFNSVAVADFGFVMVGDGGVFFTTPQDTPNGPLVDAYNAFFDSDARLITANLREILVDDARIFISTGSSINAFDFGERVLRTTSAPSTVWRMAVNDTHLAYGDITSEVHIAPIGAFFDNVGASWTTVVFDPESDFSDLTGIAFGPDYLVAGTDVDDFGYMLYSNDFDTLELSFPAAGLFQDLNEVIFNGEEYLAVGQSAYAIMSTDRVYWTTAGEVMLDGASNIQLNAIYVSPTDDPNYVLVAGHAEFDGVFGRNTFVARSTDEGETWTRVHLGSEGASGFQNPIGTTHFLVENPGTGNDVIWIATYEYDTFNYTGSTAILSSITLGGTWTTSYTSENRYILDIAMLNGTLYGIGGDTSNSRIPFVSLGPDESSWTESIISLSGVTIAPELDVFEDHLVFILEPFFFSDPDKLIAYDPGTSTVAHNIDLSFEAEGLLASEPRANQNNELILTGKLDDAPAFAILRSLSGDFDPIVTPPEPISTVAVNGGLVRQTEGVLIGDRGQTYALSLELPPPPPQPPYASDPSVVGNDFSVSTFGETGKIYSIQTVDELGGTWATQGSPIPGAGQPITLQVTVTPVDGTAFVRILVEEPAG